MWLATLNTGCGMYSGCLLVRQSFFHDDPKNFIDLGGGVVGLRGFHSSFCTTQAGLSLNTGSANSHCCSFRFLYLTVAHLCSYFQPFGVDVSTTMILKPGPVIDFLLFNQNVNDTRHIDWIKVSEG